MVLGTVVDAGRDIAGNFEEDGDWNGVGAGAGVALMVIEKSFRLNRVSFTLLFAFFAPRFSIAKRLDFDNLKELIESSPPSSNNSSIDASSSCSTHS